MASEGWRAAAAGRLEARKGTERLGQHLRERYGVEVTGVSPLDLGVYRTDLRDGTSWVARVLPAARPAEAARHDAEVLGWLQRCGYAAERLACPEPVSELAGQSVVVTQYVQPVPREERLEAIRRHGGLSAIGEALGRLHNLPYTNAIKQPGGAWHHLTDGAPEAEVAAAAALLAESEDLVPTGEEKLYRSLGDQLDTLDDGAGLPEAVAHPDFVLANLVLPAKQKDMVMVDWTGAGVGPRLWPLAFLLLAGAARGQERADRALAGYRRQVRLSPEEVARIEGVARGRPTVLAAWSFCMGRKSLAGAHADASRAADLAKIVAQRTEIAFGATKRSRSSNSSRAPAQPLANFDARALWSALDAERNARGLSWPALTTEIWQQSDLLNDRRKDHPISPSTVANMARRGSVSCQHALFMLRWLGRSPEDFLHAPAPLAKNEPLPPAGRDRRLRWDLRLLYNDLDSLRRERGYTWAELASELGCTPSQLTGLRDLKFATGINVAMRVVQWMGRAAADFVYGAEW